MPRSTARRTTTKRTQQAVAAQRRHRDARSDRTDELTAIETELAQTDQAIDRYLGAFERGTLDEEILADRLGMLRTKQKQLRHRQAELTEEIDDEPVMPARSTLRTVVQHIETIIETGDDLQRKALVEALVAEVKILGPDRLVPIFKVPRPDTSGGTANVETGDTDRPKPTRPATKNAPHRAAAAVLPATTPPKGAVRAMPTLVGLRGLEPQTSGRGRHGGRGKAAGPGASLPPGADGPFDPGMLRQIVHHVGVDPDDSGALIDLAAVAVARLAWRDGPVEDWHAGRDSRPDDAEMMRANAAITRLARDLMTTHLPGLSPGGQETVRGESPGEVFAAIAGALTAPDLRLPDGRSLSDVAPDRASLKRYRRTVRTWCARWATITNKIGPQAVLLFLASWTLTTCRHWWLGPDWPAIVERFLQHLNDTEPGDDLPSSKDGDALADRAVLRSQLLAGPDQLSADAAAFCLRHGLGRHVLPGSETR
ncbi:hypothetical protein [Frankia sp. Cr1]|uniref:hypothetical protein n=1 Tax=Frankia sp. Cr1 TaxID=3073931 RepID=UPI002AD347ED|nr:hypothetical protein [Frankia sp. Cr1]